MSNLDRDKWNQNYQSTGRGNSRPSLVLTENLHLLPTSGRALDLACGLGANAIELAKCGLDTHAWDLSETGLEILRQKTVETGLKITILQRDIILEPPGPEIFDVLVVAHFLDRSLIPHLIASLRQNGLIYYQTFIRDKLGRIGPTNPDYLLAPNELLKMFSGLNILYYKEDGTTGDLTRGLRNEAFLIAQKRH